MQLPEQLFTIQEQTWLFWGSCLLGLPVGLCLDGFRSLRMFVPHHWVMIFVEDCLLIVFGSVCVQCYAMVCARGQLRYFMFVGCILGLTLYLVTIGAVWMRMLLRIQMRIARFRGKICQVVCKIWQKTRGVFVRFSEKEQVVAESVEKDLTDGCI